MNHSGWVKITAIILAALMVLSCMVAGISAVFSNAA